MGVKVAGDGDRGWRLTGEDAGGAVGEGSGDGGGGLDVGGGGSADGGAVDDGLAGPG